MLTLNVGVPACLADNISMQQLHPVELQTGASVSFVHDVGGANMRQLNVSGNNALAALGGVLQLCTEVATSQAEEHMLHLYVSPQHVGSIIGKGGCQISDIRGLHPHVRFTMEKHPRAVAQEEGTMPVQNESPKERTMTVSGTISDASNGLLAVARVIQDVCLGYHTSPQPGPLPPKRMRTEGGYATTPFSTGPPHPPSTRTQAPYVQHHPPVQHQIQHFQQRPRPHEFAPDVLSGQLEGEFSIAIPSEAAGIIIGRGGATITQIRNSTGCKVEIDKHPQNNTAVRNLHARGGLMELEHCIRAVRERLEAGADGNEQ
eukprot:GEMP01043696.1.p1 GENE.GEMP01043696.1~~GEMP01043696.1.p1  ORF type:complete len:335 (+),score=79.39 GEMP01043696.1:56-1006(+)